MKSCLNFIDLSHPELDKFIKFGVFPKSVSDSAEIVELSENILSVKNESDVQRNHYAKK